MPGMNGLELIEKCSHILPYTAFIVMSGYAEFSYAKEAMQYGAMGYCLKPLDEDEITGLLKKTKTFLEKNRASAGDDLLLHIGSWSTMSEERVSSILEARGLFLGKKEPVIPIVSIGPEKLVFPSSISVIGLNLGLDENGYLIQQSEETDRDIVEHLKMAVSESMPGIGIGNGIRSAGDIRVCMESAILGAYQFFAVGRPGVYKAEEISDSSIRSILTLLEEKITAKDMVETDRIMNEITDEFRAGKYNIKHAFIIYNTIMSVLYKGASEQYEDFVFASEELVKMFGNAFNMLASLKKSILGDINTLRNYLPSDIKNDYFKEIVKYIDENFYKDISIQTVSQRFSINLNYLCQLFKKEMDTTFTNYLRRLRISYACKLLKETDLSVSIISERAGFGDYFYFSRIFKKYTGTTPSLYRQAQ